MLIDEKGKLFGKLNVLDGIIILIILLAVVFVGVKAFGDKKEEVVVTEKISMTFYVEEIPDFVAKAIKMGDVVTDEQKNAHLGNVTNIVIDKSISYNSNSDGKIVASEKEGYVSMKITSIMDKGTMYENGAVVEGNRYGIGHTITIRAGKGKVFAKVYDIQPVK